MGGCFSGSDEGQLEVSMGGTFSPGATITPWTSLSRGLNDNRQDRARDHERCGMPCSPGLDAVGINP